MKFVWMICVLLVMFNMVATKEVANEPETGPTKISNKTITRDGSEIKNVTQAPIKTPYSKSRKATIKNHLMDGFQVKENAAKTKISYVPSTRRPIMKAHRFTSKPHTIHYVHSRTFGEQNNFSKKRNLNARKHFKPQNKNNTTQDKIGQSDSAENRFTNFTDFDEVPKSRQNKRKNYSTRRHSIATSASKKIISVALLTPPDVNNVREKAKVAIQLSLQKIKSIRPTVNEKVGNATFKKKDSIESSNISAVDENKTNTTDKSLHVRSTTEKSVNTANKTEIIHSMTAVEKSDDSTIETKQLVQSVIETSDSSISKTEKTIDFATLADKNFASEIEISDSFSNKRNMANLTRTMLDLSVIKKEKPVPLATIATKFDNIGTETELLIPITTDKSSILNTKMNDTVAKTKNDIVSLEEREEPNEFIFIKNLTQTATTIMPQTTIENEAKATASTVHNLASRRTRRINIIEEERVATPSTGFKFNGREPYTDTDSIYRNIHT